MSLKFKLAKIFVAFPIFLLVLYFIDDMFFGFTELFFLVLDFLFCFPFGLIAYSLLLKRFNPNFNDKKENVRIWLGIIAFVEIILGFIAWLIFLLFWSVN